MISDEIKQSIIDIVHQETWKTASLTTAAIFAVGAFIIFLVKNWLLNWVQNKVSHGFNQQLEAYKAELQAKAADYQNELQQKFEMFKTVTSQIQDRRTRSNEKEYDACIECWNTLCEAFSSTRAVISQNYTYPDLNSVDAKNARKILDEYKISSYDKGQILASEDRNEPFVLALDRLGLKETKELIEKSKKTLNGKSLFFSKDLYQKLYDLTYELYQAANEQETIMYSPQQRRIMAPHCAYVRLHGEEKLDIIRDILRDNLHIRPPDFTAQSQHDEVKPSPAPQPSPPDNTPEPEPTAPK